jgi:Trk K+ transport system NAD-binding subunit
MGQVGYRVVDLLLRLGEPVQVITLTSPRDGWIREVQERGVTVLIGDARDPILLAQAGLDGARALIAATDQDLVNIEIALDAVRQRTDLTVVVRLFDQGMARHLEASFDIRKALGMSSLAAPTFASAALGEQGSTHFDAAGASFVLARLKLSEPSPLLGMTIRQLADQQHVVAITHQRRGERHHQPDPDADLQPGDRLMVLSERSGWERRFPPVSQRLRWQHFARFLDPRVWGAGLWQAWRDVPLSARAVFVIFNCLILTSVFVFHGALSLAFVDALYFVVTTVTTVGYGDITLHDASPLLKMYGCALMLLGSATMAVLFSIVTEFLVTARFQSILGQQRIPDEDHVIVVGLGNLGFHTAEALHDLGQTVVGIDKDGSRDFVEALRQELPVLIGDGRVGSVLERAGVKRASALVATTSNDLMNLAVALSAKQLNPDIRTVVRLFDPEFANKVENILNVDVAQSDSRIAAPTFVAAALEGGVHAAFVRGDTLYMLVYRSHPDGSLTALLRRQKGEPTWRPGAVEPGDEILGVITRPIQPR